MKELAVLLRALQLYAHNCHNLVSGPTFFQDHEFLGEIYSSAEGDYDSVIERMLGKKMDLDLVRVQVEAAVKLKGLPLTSAQEMFMTIAQLSDAIKQQINVVISEPISEGMKQLVGEIYNQLEIKDYKLGQRLRM